MFADDDSKGSPVNMLNSAKKFAMKNKEKIATGVDKATDAIDKKTHGKYHDKLEKVDGATAKFAGKPKDAAESTAEGSVQSPVTDDAKPVTDTESAAEADAS
jgi:hypothetical protein